MGISDLSTMPCGKCGGSGRVRGFEHIHDGVCFDCKGTGRLTHNAKFSRRTRPMDVHSFLKGDRVRLAAHERKRLIDVHGHHSFWGKNPVGTVIKPAGFGKLLVRWKAGDQEYTYPLHNTALVLLSPSSRDRRRRRRRRTPRLW